MAILTRKSWIVLAIVAVIAFITWASVAHGIVGGFASLGALPLIGMIGFTIYILTKMLRNRNIAFKGRYLSHGNSSPVSPDRANWKHAMSSRTADSGPITETNKKLIMAYIHELFTKDTTQSNEKPVRSGKITKADKKLIMAHIHELFVKDGEQTEEKYA